MADGLKTVIEWGCIQDTRLNTLINGRMASRTPKGFTNTEKAVIVILTGESPIERASVKSGMRTGLYAFRCYGGSTDPDDAREVFEAVYERFHDKSGETDTGSIVKSLFASKAVASEPSVESDTGWPVHIGFFEITTK